MCGGLEGGRVMENVARSANVLDTPLRFQLNHNDTVTTRGHNRGKGGIGSNFHPVVEILFHE